MPPFRTKTLLTTNQKQLDKRAVFPVKNFFGRVSRRAPSTAAQFSHTVMTERSYRKKSGNETKVIRKSNSEINDFKNNNNELETLNLHKGRGNSTKGSITQTVKPRARLSNSKWL